MFLRMISNYKKNGEIAVIQIMCYRIVLETYVIVNQCYPQ